MQYTYGLKLINNEVIKFKSELEYRDILEALDESAFMFQTGDMEFAVACSSILYIKTLNYSTLTNLGAFLRRIRRDHNELIKDMADKLQVTPAVISDFELGRKWIDGVSMRLLINEYNLDKVQQIELRECIKLDREI